MKSPLITPNSFFAVLWIVLMFWFRFPASAETGPSNTPRQPVLLLNSTLVEVMQKSQELGFEGRYNLLSPVLRRVFNFPVMARVAAGPFWRALSAVQQKRLAAAFAQMSISTFAARFRRYNGERFEVRGKRMAPRGSVLIQNRLVTSSGKIVPINYLLRKYGGTWKIVDVLLDAKFSELAMKRSEFTSTLKRLGFGGLIRNMEDKIRQLRENNTRPPS